MERKTDQLVDLMQKVNKQIHDHIRCVWEEQETPSTQMMIMYQIAKAEGITVSEVARRVGLAKSHVSKTIDELAHMGHVEKRPDPQDGRILRLYRTPQAVSYWDAMQAQIRARLSQVVDTLPADKTEGLIEGLQLLAAAIGAAREQEKARG